MPDEIKALRALVRGRDDLVAERVALANQLRSLLEDFWPGAAAIFAAIDSLIALAFVARYPTPNNTSRLGEKRLASFMAQHAYCGRRSPAELLARLHAAPKDLAGTGAEVDAKGELVRVLAVLERLVHEIAKLSSRIEHAVAELPDGQIVMSFPRASRICGAQILSELRNVRERFQTEDQLAAEAGVELVTHAFGKSRGVVFRWACNKKLRVAITCFADNSRHASGWGASIYTRCQRNAAASTPMPCASSYAPGPRALARLAGPHNPLPGRRVRGQGAPKATGGFAGAKRPYLAAVSGASKKGNSVQLHSIFGRSAPLAE